MTDQPNLQAIVQQMLVDYTAWVNGEPVAWNVKKQEAIDAIYAAVKHDVLGQQITDNQAIALQRWCYGDDK